MTAFAVCVLMGTALGTINFQQEAEGQNCTISATLSNLTAGLHGFHIHTYGDLSGGCGSTAGHFNPDGVDHGTPTDPPTSRYYGDLGNIEADQFGVAEVNITDSLVTLFGPNSVIGRAVVVHAGEDDLGRGNYSDSKTTGHAGGRVGCGVIGLAN